MSFTTLFRTTLMAPLLALGLAGTAGAEERPWYFHANLGTSSVSNPSVNLGSNSVGQLKIGSGSTNGGALGRRLSPDLRLEAEISYRSNSLKNSTAGGIDTQQPDADYAALFLFANLLYDLPGWSTSFATFRPYVGVGLGRAQEIDTDLKLGGAAREFSGSKAASQWLLGVNWDYNSAWSAGLSVRGTRVSKLALKGSGPANGQTLTTSYRGTTALVTLGYRF